MLHHVIFAFLLLQVSSSSAPNNFCNPSVQTMISQPILSGSVGSRIIMTFPKAHTVVPYLVTSFINFQSASNYSSYDLWILPGTGVQSTSLTLTNYDFMVKALATTIWTQVKISFLLINSTAEQFLIVKTFLKTHVKTNGTANQKDIFTEVVTAVQLNVSNTFVLAAFNNGFLITTLAIVPQWFRPGYVLNFGLFNATALWYSVRAIQNTVIVSTSFSFLIMDTTSTTPTIYRFDKQTVYLSNMSPNITVTTINPYDQYCIMTGINSFRFNYTIIPDFTLNYPNFTLTSTLSASATTANFSINVTVLNIYVLQCIAPDIYYILETNSCYSQCPQNYYPSPPYCKQCHYTCNNCSVYNICAICLDTAQTTKTLAGDFCICLLGYFDNGANCSLCNSTCVSCAGDQNNCTACYTGFEVINTFCIEICGDGVVYNLACDDGNTLAGDGCSVSCIVEENYTCINGTSTTPSVCSYNQPFQLKFVSSAQGDSNIVYINLIITPHMVQFPSLNFSQYISINLPFKSISHSYSDSSLNLIVDFIQPLNNTYTQLIVQLSPPTSSSNNFMWKSSSVMVPYGKEIVLYYQVSYSVSDIIKIILIVVEAFLFLGLILTYRKIVPLQFLMTVQIVALSTSYISQNYAFVLTFKYLHQIGINGYNGIFNDFVSPISVEISLSRLGYSPQLFINYNLMFILNICFAIIGFVFYLIQSKVDPPHSDRLEKVNSYLKNQILPTIFLFSLINLSFSIGETANAYSSVDSDIFKPTYLSSNLSIMFASLFMLALLCENYRSKKTTFISKRGHFKEGRDFQIQFIIWIMYKFATGFIMGVAHNYKYSLIALILLTFGYILYSLITRSIRTPLLIAMHLYSQFVILYLFIVLIIYQHKMIDQLTIPGMIPGLLLAVFLAVGTIFILIYAGYSMHQTIKICIKKTPLTKMEYFNNKQIMNQHYQEVNRLRRENMPKIKRKAKNNNMSEGSVEIV